MYIVASPAFHYAEQNPYTSQLYEQLRQRGHRVEDFEPSLLVRGRPDIWHLHWPDYQLSMRSAAHVGARVAALAAVLLLAKARGTRVVWTAHNLHSHEGRHPVLEKVLWSTVQRALDGVIALSSAGADEVRRCRPALRELPCEVIPHGHYRDVYGAPVDQATARERLGLPIGGLLLLHLGQLRPYKNVDGLIDAFADASLPDASLVIAGQPMDHTMREAIERAAHGRRDVTVRLQFVPREDIPLFHAACDLVVLPYSTFSNSGSAILALSFDRPIIVPQNAAMRELQDWYGRQWVRTYDGDLTGETLERLVSAPLPSGRLALPQLEWPAIATRTEQFYRRLVRQK